MIVYSICDCYRLIGFFITARCDAMHTPYDLGVFVRTEFNRILCTSKSEAAVTSKKTVEADYGQT